MPSHNFSPAKLRQPQVDLGLPLRPVRPATQDGVNREPHFPKLTPDTSSVVLESLSILDGRCN